MKHPQVARINEARARYFKSYPEKKKQYDAEVLFIYDRVMRTDILALILYTGCRCTYDLCKAERDGDYAKWKYFSAFLWLAVWKLRSGPCRPIAKLYSGRSPKDHSTQP